MKRPSKPFEIPPELVEQLNEYSKGGFILISRDCNGEPLITSKTDSSIDLMAMIQYFKNYAEGVEMVYREAIVQGIFDKHFPNSEED